MTPGSAYARRRGDAVARPQFARIAAVLLTAISAASLQAQSFDQPRTLTGHHGPVMMGVFTPGGELAVTAGADHTLRVWEAATGKEIRVFEQHTGPVYCLAVSADGRTLVSGAQDNTVRVWDLPLSKPLREMKLAEAAVASFATGPGGSFAVCVDGAGALKRYDLPAGANAATSEPVAKDLPPHGAPGTSVAMRNDGAFFAVADEAGRVSIWSPYLEERQGEFLAHESAVTALRFRANDQRLVSAGADGMLRIWQLVPAPARMVAAGVASVSRAAPLPGQKAAIVGAPDGSARIVGTEMGELVRELPKQASAVTAIAAAPNGTWLAIGTEAGELAGFMSADAQPRALALGHSGAIRDAAVHADAARFATAGDDGTVRLWTLPTTMPGWVEAKGHTAPVRDLAIAPAGEWFVTVSDDLTTRQWNAAGGALRQLAVPQAALRSVAVRADGGALITGDAAGEIRLWNSASGAAEGVVMTTDGPAIAVALAGDGSTALTIGESGAVRGWKLPLPAEKPKEGEPALEPIWSQAASPGPPRVAVGLPGDQGFLVTSPDRKNVQRLKVDGTTAGADLAGPGGAILTLAASRDFARIAVVDDAGSAKLFDAAGAAIAQFPLGKGVVDAAFSPDGKELALADGTDRVRIVDAGETAETPLVREIVVAPFPATRVGFVGTNGTQLVVSGSGADAAVLKRSLLRLWKLSEQAAREVVFSADQQHLFASAADGSVRQLRLTDGEIVNTLADLDDSGVFAVSPDSQRLVARGADGKLAVRTLADGAVTAAIDLPTKLVDLSVSADNLRAFVACDDGAVRVFDLVTGDLLQTFPKGPSPLVGVAYAPESQALLAVASDGALRFEKPSIVRAMKVHPGAVRSLALLNGGVQAATVGEDGTPLLTDLESRALIRTYDLDGLKATALAARNDSQRLAIGTEAGKLLVVNPGNGEKLATLEVGAPIVSAAWSVDNLKLVVADAAKQVHIFGPSLPGQAQQELTLHQKFDAGAAVREVGFDPANRAVWTALEDGRLAQWAYASPVPVRQFNHGGAVYGVAIGKSGRTVVSCSADQTVRVWDATTGQQRFQMNGHQGAVHAIALNKEETFAVTSGADGTLRLWDVVGGRQLKQLAKYDATTYAVAIHPAGQTVAAAGADRKVRLLDILAGTESAVLESHDDYIHGLAYRPDGAQLASYGYAGSLKIWNPASPTPLVQHRVGSIGNSVAYDDDGDALLLSCGDGVARIVAVPK
ncbi:MAG TPA: PQQ-binding-like beta-propeller repeat protein [Pirellulaceae bacterium]|jgi:WD40 repeat protein|nr:PQQ-binding-like beta-propeller repeat protein [Pirellulaceae bacterium]